MKKLFLYLILPVLLCVTDTLAAQGWLHYYSDSFGSSIGTDAKETADGGAILLSEVDYPTGAIRHFVRLTKTDADGLLQWERVYNEGQINHHKGHTVLVLADGGYLIGGSNFNPPGLASTMMLMRTNALGDTLWTKSYSVPEEEGYILSHSVIQTADDGFLLAGEHQKLLQGAIGGAPYFVKVDADGNEQWRKDYLDQDAPSSGLKVIYDIKEVTAGGYIGVGVSNEETYLMRLDAAGDSLWTRSHFITTGSRAYAVVEGPDQAFYVAGDDSGFAGYSPSVSKFDDTGELIWNEIVPAGLGGATSIILTEDNELVVSGTLNAGASTETQGILEQGFLANFNLDGTNNWTQILSDESQENTLLASSVVATADGGYLLCGAKANSTAFLQKTNSAGFSFTHTVVGTLTARSTCGAPDSIALGGWMIRLSDGEQTFYTISEADGRYQILSDTGAFELTVIPPAPLWDLCNAPVLVDASEQYGTTVVDLEAVPLEDCAYLQVDVSTSLLRRCFDNVYYLNYCNWGTVVVEGAYIEVVLDPFLEITNASVPYTLGADNTVIFEVGTLDVGACGVITFDAYLNCDEVEQGQTHCVEATIYPIADCVQPDIANPLIMVGARCEGDSVVFTIKNIGNAAMSAPSQYIVIEDDVMYLQMPYNLDAGDSTEVAILAEGATYRLETLRTPNAFNGEFVSATLEGCNSESGSIGFVNQYSLNDNDPYYDLDCQQNVGSYDPNDKMGLPLGYGEAHSIRPEAPLDYWIRFQNTGTDTAFSVVIRDTLSEYLDLESIKIAGASHAFRWDVSGDRVLKFTFDPIALPDSNVNELASHGFVKFQIATKADLPIGTEIYNRAGIYFDYNAPVITNTTLHTIGQPLIDILNDVTDPQQELVQLSLFPNPATANSQLQLLGQRVERGSFILHNASGQAIAKTSFTGRTIDFDLGLLSSGLYFFQIMEGTRIVGSGKLLIK